jgi:serine protease Do
MRSTALVAALVAAGVIGTGVAAYQGHVEAPVSQANASPVHVAAVATPAASPGATTLPLNGFTEIVKKAGPAVVNISVNATRKASAEMPQIPEEFREFFRGFGGKNMPNFPNMPRGDTPMRGLGSGFIVSPDGYILTNAHVVDGADSVTVRLTDRREFRAKVVGADKQTDIAVLKIEAKSLPTVRLGRSQDANVGEWVVAIGSPYGFDNTVTAGIVSAKSRSLPDANYTPFIQTDVAVNPGNSGGPLFNLAGEVIGINSQIYSRSGGFQGISFAIPIEVALNVKDQLIKTGKVSRGRLGVTVQEVNATFAEAFNLDRPRGAIVSSVDAGGPAEKAGLQVNDIILSYNGQPIERSSDLPVLVANTTPGKSAQVQVWRKGSEKTLTVGTYEGKAAKDDDDDVASGERGAAGGKLGLAVRPLTPEEKREAKGRTGLLVEDVGGPAARAGIQPGDLVISFNGTPVKTVDELKAQVSKAGKRVAILIMREGQQIFVPVELG